MENIGRKVNIISIGFSATPAWQCLSAISKLLGDECKEGVDLIVLPEMCFGMSILRIDSEAVEKICDIAKQKRTYICLTFFRGGDGNDTYNSSLLIDRDGKIAGVYDKAYPFWSDEHNDPPCIPGKDVPVFCTDFGIIGISNCFDVNFPSVYERLSEQGAELILYPSGYSAGASLQAHAINHNFYIVSSTLIPDCAVYDINGREIHYQKASGDLNISRLSLDLDRCVFHYDLNIAKRDKLLAEHHGEVEQDSCLEREAWFTLKAIKPGVSVRKLAAEYGLEELGHYKKRKRNELDQLRGFSLK
jgi:predicted amidohydrolase